VFIVGYVQPKTMFVKTSVC